LEGSFGALVDGLVVADVVQKRKQFRKEDAIKLVMGSTEAATMLMDAIGNDDDIYLGMIKIVNLLLGLG
jgi:hypothetical protein